MSYRITINGDPFCSSEFEHSAVLNPKVVLEVNKSGSLTFTMMPDHPFYNSIEFRQSLFDVFQNDELIFEGVPVSETTDFWNRKTVVCEGELTFLNDTIQRQAVYQNQTVQSLLSSYLSVHNAQADVTKQFTVGSVTVSGGNTIYRYTNYQSTMQELQEDLIENFGGYFRIRHSGGVRYLDYLDSSPHNSSQTIRIGKNLVDFSRNLSSLDICTVLIPLGAKTGNQLIDGLDERLDIKSVNGNLDYLVGTAQAYYGNIWRTQVWDDVTTAAALKTKGQDYLDDVQWANLVISATAFDLGLATEDVEQFHVLDMIKVVSEPHGIDRYFMLTKLEMDLDHPASTKITLGKDERLSLSAQTAKAEVTIERQPTNILVSASESARQILDSATDGAIQFLYNQDGVLYEMRINNSQDPSTATKWWRYNAGGWAYTDDGGQTYSVAATMDGTIYANLIKAGILSDDNNIFSINFANGEAVLNKLTSTNAQINGGNIDITAEQADQSRVEVKYLYNGYEYYGRVRPYGTAAVQVAPTFYQSSLMLPDMFYTYYGADYDSAIQRMILAWRTGLEFHSNTNNAWLTGQYASEGHFFFPWFENGASSEASNTGYFTVGHFDIYNHYENEPVRFHVVGRSLDAWCILQFSNASNVYDHVVVNFRGFGLNNGINIRVAMMSFTGAGFRRAYVYVANTQTYNKCSIDEVHIGGYTKHDIVFERDNQYSDSSMGSGTDITWATFP